jgi:hypothetical protein
MIAPCMLAAASLIAQWLQVYSEFVKFNPQGEAIAPAVPREILSPALVRNGFTSFQIAVRVDPGTPYSLVVGENPEDAVKATVYRERGDKLEPVSLPYSGDTTQVFWMDVWTDRDAPVRRIKIEPQLNVNNDWVVYPMEARVMKATVPEAGREQPLCRANFDENTDMGRLRFRNARQDGALRTLAPLEDLRSLLNACRLKDPESYLPIRDYLLRMR